jgi:hypothetical protein
VTMFDRLTLSLLLEIESVLGRVFLHVHF